MQVCHCNYRIGQPVGSSFCWASLTEVCITHFHVTWQTRRNKPFLHMQRGSLPMTSWHLLSDGSCLQVTAEKLEEHVGFLSCCSEEWRTIEIIFLSLSLPLKLLFIVTWGEMRVQRSWVPASFPATDNHNWTLNQSSQVIAIRTPHSCFVLPMCKYLALPTFPRFCDTGERSATSRERE